MKSQCRMNTQPKVCIMLMSCGQVGPRAHEEMLHALSYSLRGANPKLQSICPVMTFPITQYLLSPFHVLVCAHYCWAYALPLCYNV